MVKSRLILTGVPLMLLSLLVIAPLVAANPAPVVTPGQDPAFIGGGGVRYRSFANTGGNEIYLGVPDLGGAGNRVEVGFTWTKPGTHNMAFTYDKDNDKLTTTVVSTSLEYTSISSKAKCPVSDWTGMLIIVVLRDSSPSAVSFNNVFLDSYSLGSFTGVYNVWLFWTVSNFDFSKGFTLTGSIELAGPFSTSQELSKVEVQVGCGLPRPVEPTVGGTVGLPSATATLLALLPWLLLAVVAVGAGAYAIRKRYAAPFLAR